MELVMIESIFHGLNEAGVRYLVVGGMAVVAHGYLRLTVDVDLFVDLAEDNLRKCLTVFEKLRYVPRPPVALTDFLCQENRRRWRIERNLLVFSLWNPDHPSTEVDLFNEEPFPFTDGLARSVRIDLSQHIRVPVIGLDDLICMKQKAGRPKDLDDIEQLRKIKEAGNEAGG